MQLFVMRHGQTNNNIKRLMTGRYDEDINETGIEQAKAAIDEIKTIDYDVILSSPLLRAKHTAQIINIKKLPIIYDDRLMERDMGHLANTSTHLDIDRYDFWNIAPKQDYIDVEPLRDMYNRAAEFFCDIKERYAGRLVLAVTHDGLVRVLHSYLYGIPENGALLEGNIRNCEIRQMLY
ncbi:MAG: histidine phosphatase family protein [Oscillospiraceae bacterium]|nr:histidine phosphatase family protein [Oscillospiraceae bacterium]